MAQSSTAKRNHQSQKGRITENVALEALQEKEKMYRALVESASDMVYRTNR